MKEKEFFILKQLVLLSDPEWWKYFRTSDENVIDIV